MSTATSLLATLGNSTLVLVCKLAADGGVQLRDAIHARRRPRRAPASQAAGDGVEMQNTAAAPAPTEDSLKIPEASIAQWGGALLQLDTALAQLRFESVPAHLSEEVFWETYFKHAAKALRDKFAGADLQVMSEARSLIGCSRG
eukprot:TRINITY_DN4144_c0_g1_i1.p1 TRINITY_DN4144_c0_g1~~TRINITY_DN4144_c0_g1_i1.p1  ORF type:complete len:144 (+),score=39.54 TRINITY_DN4144_c0_g1_i1:404-835(+)